MDFDLSKARRDGYTDVEIATHLSNQHGFNLEAAMRDGYSETEIAETLASTPLEPKLEQDVPKTPKWAGESPNLYGAFGAAKETYQKAIKPAIEATGLIGGGAVAAPTGPVGQVAGAGIGYGIAKKFTDIIDKWIGRIEGIKKSTTLTNETVKTLNDIKSGAEMEMLGQSLGSAIPRWTEKISAPFQKGMTPEAEELLALAKERGIELTPAEITGSKTLALGESLLEKVPGATDVIREMRIKGQLEPLFKNLDNLRNQGASKQSTDAAGRKIWEQVTDYLEKEKRLKGDTLNAIRTKVLGKLGTSESLYNLGLRGKELLKAKTVAYNERVKEAYSAVKDSLPDGEFQFDNLAKEAKSILDQKTKLAGQDKTMLAHLDWASKTTNIPKDIEKKLAELPETVRRSILNDMEAEFMVKRDWETMQDFASEMSALSSKQDAIGMAMPGMKFQQTPEGAVYNRLRQAALKDMEQIAEKTGGEAWEKYQAAKAIYSEGAAIYKSKTIRSLAKTNPENLIDIAFKPNGMTEVKLMKEALGTKGFLDLRDGFTNKLLGVGKHDTFDPNFLRSELMRYGDDFLSEVYGKTTVSGLKSVAKYGLDLSLQRPGQAFLRSIAKEYPEAVVDKIVGAPESKLQSNNLLKNIQIIKQAIGKNEFEVLGEKLFDKLISLNQTSDMVRPQTFAKMVDKYGDRVLKQFYPPEKVAELQKLAKLGHKIQSAEVIAGNPSGTGQTLIAWGITRMIMIRPIQGAIVAITPKQLGRLYASKFGLKWLTYGFKVPASSKAGVEIGSKILAIMNEQE
jgi:hypothetical protein